MTHLVGSTRLPCGHHHLSVTRSESLSLAGTRKCRTCRRSFSFALLVATHASAMCGVVVQRIEWS